MFHNAAKMRQVRNSIPEVKCPNGIIANNDEDIKLEAVRFFQKFLTHKPDDIEDISINMLQELMQFQCNDLEKGQLIKEVTREEIKRTLFKMEATSLQGRMDIPLSSSKRLGQW